MHVQYSDDDEMVEKEGSDDELKRGVYYDLFADEDRLSQDSKSAFTPEKKENSDAKGDDDKDKKKEEKDAVRVRKKVNILTFKPAHLTSERGLYAVVNDFPKLEFRGEGHEKEDLQLLMKNYEHWGNRLFPKLRLSDLLERIEAYGSKAEVKMCVKHIRSGGRVPHSDLLGDGGVDGDELGLRTENQVAGSNAATEGIDQELVNEEINSQLDGSFNEQLDDDMFDMAEDN